MVNFYDDFGKVDKDLQEEGVWVQINSDAKIKIRSVESKSYKKALALVIKKYSNEWKNVNNLKKIDVEGTSKLDKALLEITAKHLIIDWEGSYWTDFNGNGVSYSEEQALEYLEGSKAFRELLQDLTGDEATFQKERIEESKKSLGKQSNTGLQKTTEQ